MQEVAEKLASATRVVAITGAGVSAESGIDTFRGAGGHWGKYKAEDLASPYGFQQDPELVWRWYVERRAKILESTPNPGHYALAELERIVPQFTLITQNVDGLHQQAGSVNVLPIHGDIWNVRCVQSGQVWKDPTLFDAVPSCKCGAKLRPDILWFGETYKSEDKSAAYTAIAESDVLLLIGTSGAIRIIHDFMLKAAYTYSVEINITASEVNYLIDKDLFGPSGEVLPQLVERVKELKTL